MSVAIPTARPSRAQSLLRRARAQFGDWLLIGVSALAALFVVAVMVEIGYQVINGATLSFSKFGLGFLTQQTWKPNFNSFGALTLIYGTAVTSAMALVLAVPIGIAIGLFLSQLAPKRLAAVIGPIVEMLAAIPSVILGFWGIVVLSPFIHQHIEPALHSSLGFIPIFGKAQTTGSGLFTAGLILAIMVVPIIASLSRDLFLTVPRELKDGATALGATDWEVTRGVVLPTTFSGVVAASVLGLGRALGEAIAVTQVIGAGNAIHASLFEPGDTLASRIANQFAGAFTKLHTSSLFYLAAILLVIGLMTNLFAHFITVRFGHLQAARQ
jgi:phosphate transport system permease protein